MWTLTFTQGNMFKVSEEGGARPRPAGSKTDAAKGSEHRTSSQESK